MDYVRLPFLYRIMYEIKFSSNKDVYMSISGPGATPPSYSSDFRQSVELFEKSFKELQTSTLPAQRSQYVKVMQETLQAMQDISSATVNKELLKLKNQLSEDLNTYLASPSDTTKKNVESDLSALKKEGIA